MFIQSIYFDRFPCHKQTTRTNQLVLVLVGLLASAVPSDVVAEPVYTLKEAMDSGVDIKLTSEGCYAGECVSVYAFNRNDETVNLKISKGDVLLNKHEDEQNLVVTADLTMVIPARQAVEHRLSTLCLDAAEAGPSEGRVFDVAANLREWPAGTPAPMLLAALEEAAGQGLERSDWLQEVTWKLTDDYQVASTAGQDLLRSIGVDPEGTAPSFPHLSNPNRSGSDTGYVATLVASESLPELSRFVGPDIRRSVATEDGRANGFVGILAIGGVFVAVLLGVAAVRRSVRGAAIFWVPSQMLRSRDDRCTEEMLDNQKKPKLRKNICHVSMAVVLCSVIILGCSIATVPERSGSNLPRVAYTPAENESIMSAAERWASSLAEGLGGNEGDSGNLYRMVVAYHGFGAALAALHEICAGYPPGLILTVYRPGDLDRDRWCVARYQEVDEILAIAAAN